VILFRIILNFDKKYIMKRNLLKISQVFTVLALLAGTTGYSQTLMQEFIDAGYSLTDLGSINLLPAQYGGLTIRPEDPNTLYIGGDANSGGGVLYTVPLVRDPESHHITAFGGDAVQYCLAPNNDGGIFFAPNGTLLFTRYSMNEMGQINTENTYISTPLTQYGISSSVGSVVLVPSGYPGAGNMVIASYNGSILYKVPFTINASGFYEFAYQTAEVSVYPLTSGPEGIAYIPIGSAGFTQPSMVISSYGNGTVVVYEVGEHGLPDVTTGREMVTGLSGAEGALIDPVTGDFLFSTFGGGNKVIRISGFVAPSGIGDGKDHEAAAFTLYPNPTDGPLSLEITDPSAEGTIRILNLPGQQVLDRQFSGSGLYDIDLSSQPNGVYILYLQDRDKTGMQRIIKK